jgi:hypothetical protein
MCRSFGASTARLVTAGVEAVAALAANSLSVRLAGRRLEPLAELASELAASGAAVEAAAIRKWCRAPEHDDVRRVVPRRRRLSAQPAGEIAFLAPTRERRTT